MIINSIKEKDDIKHFVMYVLIGIVAVGSDNIIFNYLRNLNLSMYVSNFISVNCGLTVSFICNTFINFKKANNLVKRGGYFFIIGYIGMSISMVFLHYGVIFINISESLTKLISTAISGLMQFTLNKVITFRE